MMKCAIFTYIMTLSDSLPHTTCGSPLVWQSRLSSFQAEPMTRSTGQYPCLSVCVLSRNAPLQRIQLCYRAVLPALRGAVILHVGKDDIYAESYLAVGFTVVGDGLPADGMKLN